MNAMNIAMVRWSGEERLALFFEGRWLDVGRISDDYHVEPGKKVGLGRIGELIRGGLFNPALWKRLVKKVEKAGRLDLYTFPSEPDFCMPYRPGKIVAIGRNYRAHVAEFDNKMPAEPIYFAKSPSTCIGPNAPIEIPKGIGRVDHEGELGVIIGKQAKNVSTRAAKSHVLGYTVINDVTARDLQKKDIANSDPWYRSKNFDTFCPMGPCIALRDALPWPVYADIEVRVNGEVRQKSNTEKFIFSIPKVIAEISKVMTLEAGDVISTGTPEGVSPILPGDEVVVNIPGIGQLRNPVKQV
jgi:2-keto-4-pentenoate hydratase/2-oxohepta-3-ene-1,7-dioic acid hydratase in catechol pathway